MPRGNRTGPDGMGPLTGRGMGPCDNGISGPGLFRRIGLFGLFGRRFFSRPNSRRRRLLPWRGLRRRRW